VACPAAGLDHLGQAKPLSGPPGEPSSPLRTLVITPELDEALLNIVAVAGLPEEEPIIRWMVSDREEELRLRAGDDALIIGQCEYHAHPDTGWLEVRDYTDRRSMRSQVYQPDRPGQPMLPPHVEARQV
jgi:hypothetical protein